MTVRPSGAAALIFGPFLAPSAKALAACRVHIAKSPIDTIGASFMIVSPTSSLLQRRMPSRFTLASKQGDIYDVLVAIRRPRVGCATAPDGLNRDLVKSKRRCREGRLNLFGLLSTAIARNYAPRFRALTSKTALLQPVSLHAPIQPTDLDVTPPAEPRGSRLARATPIR